jgi:hypothetical protein
MTGELPIPLLTKTSVKRWTALAQFIFLEIDAGRTNATVTGHGIHDSEKAAASANYAGRRHRPTLTRSAIAPRRKDSMPGTTPEHFILGAQ